LMPLIAHVALGPGPLGVPRRRGDQTVLRRVAAGDEHVVRPERRRGVLLLGGGLVRLRLVAAGLRVLLPRLVATVLVGPFRRRRPRVLPGAGVVVVLLLIVPGVGLLLAREWAGVLLLGQPALRLREPFVEGVDEAPHVAEGHAEARRAHVASPQAQHERAVVPGDPEHAVLAA